MKCKFCGKQTDGHKYCDYRCQKWENTFQWLTRKKKGLLKYARRPAMSKLAMSKLEKEHDEDDRPPDEM